MATNKVKKAGLPMNNHNATPGPVGGVYPKFVTSRRDLVNSRLSRSGLPYWLPGWIRRDYLPDLQGRRAWLIYEQMGSNDAYVGSALNVYSLFIRRTAWHVDPVVDENKANGSADFLQTCMDDMGHSWQTFIATAARPCLQFGFAPFEKLYKLREGEQDDERLTSEFWDGNVGWADLSFLSPDSVLHWDYDPDDVTRLLGLTQLSPPDYRMTYIPMGKLLNLRSDPGRDNPEGRSILRTVWRSWRTKTYQEDFRNMIIERGGAGIPWAEVPANIANAPELIKDNPTDPKAIEAMASYTSIVEVLEKIALSEKQWMITPQVFDPKTGQPQIKISFLQASMSGDITAHITQSIEAEAKAILIATGTEFQALGMGGSGSLALSRDKTDNFTLAVAAIATSFRESINSQAVRQLFRLNPDFEFERGKPRPKIVYDPLVPLSTQDVTAMLSLFEKAGWDLSKQNGIRDALIKNLGLPDYIEEQVNEELQENGSNPIQNLLEGKSALDQILGPAGAQEKPGAEA